MKKYTFNNSTETKTADILINGEIDGYWSYGLKELSEELKTAKAENINIQINSPGGSVTEGAAIAAFISGYKKPINTSGFGLVASIATKILLAGSSVSMAEGSYFMIHQPWAAVGGESEELRKTADLLDKMKAELIQVYISKIAQNKKLINGSYEETLQQLEKWIDSETWFTASEALAAGFIDKVTTGVQFLNKSNYQNIYNSVQNFKNVPENLTNQFKNFADMQTTKNGTNLGAFLTAAVEGMASDEMTSEQVVLLISEAAEISAEAVNDILSGSTACPPLENLEAFASVLDLSIEAITEAAAGDECEYITEKTEEMEKEKDSILDKVKAWFKSNPEEAEKLAEDLKAKNQADKEAEILKAVQIAKDNGFYLEAKKEEIKTDHKPVKDFNLQTEIQRENEALKAALKAAEEKAAAPSAGAGNKSNNNNTQSIESLICPTAEHKEFVNFWGSKFQ